jgi:geranylgeranyl pyrophosphate synthase
VTAVLNERRQDVAARVQAHLDWSLEQYDGVVADAMAYASRGGKRLRALFVMEGARLHGIAPDQAVWPASAIEALHAYSLVHDDLPCMDDDDARRGQPTVHRHWDEATAVLAGDALQTLAFELVTDPRGPPDGAVRADLALSLARAAGAGGMVLGQALDIAAESAATPLTLDEITGDLLLLVDFGQAEPVETIMGALRSPTRARDDIEFELTAVRPGYFLASLDTLAVGPKNLELLAPDGSWRISERILLPLKGPVDIAP